MQAGLLLGTASGHDRSAPALGNAFHLVLVRLLELDTEHQTLAATAAKLVKLSTDMGRKERSQGVIAKEFGNEVSGGISFSSRLRPFRGLSALLVMRFRFATATISSNRARPTTWPVKSLWCIYAVNTVGGPFVRSIP